MVDSGESLTRPFPLRHGSRLRVLMDSLSAPQSEILVLICSHIDVEAKQHPDLFIKPVEVTFMCNESCIEFARRNLKEQDIRGKSVIEVGSLDVNGSVRPFIQALGSSSYTGIDIIVGPGVDQICDASDLLNSFGREKFDVLISTEVLEHVRDWRRVISNFKNIVKPNGLLVITTRSKGFPFHAAPSDFWRYELSDMRAVFSDFVIEAMETDPQEPGVFVKVRKPEAFRENDLTNYQLYSMLKDRRVATTITWFEFLWWCKLPHLARQSVINTVPEPIARTILGLSGSIFRKAARSISR